MKTTPYSTVLEKFRRNVEMFPDNTAIVFENISLTYREVDRLSDNLAAYIESQVPPKSVVGIMLGRNEYMMLAPLGALKAGCAYLPLDPSYPPERLAFMMKDAGARMLLADEDLLPILKEYDGPVLKTEDIRKLHPGKPSAQPAPEDLFLLLYTSGTTGTPKGCMLSHQNVFIFCDHHRENVGFDNNTRMTGYASFGFDAFASDMYTSIISGSTLYIIPERIRLNLAALHSYFEENGITHCFMTTQVATQFAINYPECKGLKVMYTGGEKMSSFPLPKYRLFNCYGPTECMCYVVCEEVKVQEENIPIGLPLPGIHTYIVDKDGHQVPQGENGELWIAGLQVGMGYLNRPDKTAEAFLENPFEKDPDYARVYRTGDIVRYRPDGKIEYVGRKDGQVKIRGFRIELKEVEAVIREFPGIKDVTVQAFDEPGAGAGKFLAAYIVGSGEINIQELNDFIASRKPPYMVPAVTMQIDAIPLNINQKVDVKALPRPEPRNHKQETHVAPLNVLEEEISALIRESVGISGFGLTDPLYYSGLSSLSALRLATELYNRYGLDPDMNTFVKTASLQSIENDILKILMAKDAAQETETESAADEPQELTFQQTGLYLDCVRNPSSTAYNLPFILTFPEGTGGDDLKRALRAVLEAHPAVLGHFEQKDGKVFLMPGRMGEDIPYTTLKSEEEFLKLKETFMQPYNLGTGPLYCFNIVKTPFKLRLMGDIHHLVFDGRSYDVFLEQLTAAMEGKAPEMESYTYFQYAKDQQAYQDSPEFKEAEDFFTSQLAAKEDETGVLPDKKPQEDTVGHELWLRKKIGCDVTARCHALGISPASYFLGAAFVTVSAFSGQQKVFMCTVANGRNDMRSSNTFGMFVNTIALAGEVAGQQADEFLKETDRNFSKALSYQNYPFARVSSAFDFHPAVMLAYQVGLVEKYSIGGKVLEDELLTQDTPKFPLSIFIEGTEDAPEIALAYDDSLYNEPLIQSFADTLETVCRGLLKDGPLTGIQFVDGPILQQLDSFNNYSQEVDLSRTVVDLFREQARATPDAAAVLFDGKTISYGELDRYTDALAAKIQSLGLGEEDVVSVLINRNAWMTKASLAAMKAGCAYQPLDPSYPAERLNFMIKDAGARLLIAEPGLVPLVCDYKGPVLTTDNLEDLPEATVLHGGPKPENMYILLYTSGSTGKPKGCMLEHHNLVNFCAWYREYFDLHPGDRVAAFASYGFDANMMDQYPALTSGACVCIIPEEVRHDLKALDAFITDNGVTHSFMTTQVGVLYARNFPDNPSLKHLSTGGEKLVSMAPPSYAFYNGYGPTECTIFTTIFRVLEREDNIPIGHPLSNVLLYVVDRQMRRLPVGAAGELLISGAGVSRGYLNNPEKTAESYIENPFVKGMRAYHSGDIVRYRSDGNIEFVGRKDRQVKIRGFRIELKEVEEVIREIPDVQDVTVQAFDSPSGGKFLAAYVVLKEGTLDAKAAADFIRERKPPYMAPAAWVQLDAIPLNVNQKVDVKALPPATPTATEDYVAPVGETETALCNIFASLLGVDRVGAIESFFDLGGTSLMVTNVMVEAEKQGLHFAYSDVFSHPSARALAAFLNGGQTQQQEDSNITGYDYTDIDLLLEENNLDSFRNGEGLSLGRNILLAGATGFLGIHVLKELLDSTGPDTTIWCLLRGKGSLTPERRLTEMLVYYFEKDYRNLLGKRIRVVEGDITRPESFASLEGIDMVFNCAANVKHFSKGTDIEDINYGGVKNLVEFCEKRDAYLVQVSTESVGGLTPGSVPDTLTEQMLFFGQLTDNQYVHSKFLAERIILEHMAQGRLKAKIMRAGNLSPRAEDGEFQVNMNSNASMGRLKAFKMLGACPYHMLEGEIEFTPIDQAAHAMVLLARTPLKNCVFNVSNNHIVPMDDVLTRLEKIDGKPLEYVEMPEFLQRMEAAQTDPAKARILAPLIAYQQSVAEQEGVETLASTAFTMQVLHRLGFRWNHTSSEYVDLIFEMLRTLQYFD
ncbi:MAG: amino acid adenylation domain-containing protein [Bacteroidales bacterium]|nr:amino acid adenylation domain-containing protein [Bacteroidales bacterium]